uniref:Uncharacterized protein n=1 Tax=Timema cristinae TaxID=61476 RepID=A0A7R9CJZ6_TIMCR|nr:unnamed protein product [Timema cristinae]
MEFDTVNSRFYDPGNSVPLEKLYTSLSTRLQTSSRREQKLYAVRKQKIRREIFYIGSARLTSVQASDWVAKLASAIEVSSQENIQLTPFNCPCVSGYESERKTTQPSIAAPRNRLASAIKVRTAPNRVRHITKSIPKSLSYGERTTVDISFPQPVNSLTIKRFILLSTDPILIDENIHPHADRVTQTKITALVWEHLDIVPHSPDLDPNPINSSTPIDVKEMLNSSLNLEPFNIVEERFARKRRSSERKARSPHTLLELLGLDTKKEDAIKSYNGDKFGFDALLSGMFPMRRSLPETAEFCQPFLDENI